MRIYNLKGRKRGMTLLQMPDDEAIKERQDKENRDRTQTRYQTRQEFLSKLWLEMKDNIKQGKYPNHRSPNNRLHNKQTKHIVNNND